MSKIQILSEDLANQIAAGEVIERPASVVKELVENAIDAGSENISIQVEGNGTRLIRIIDDGEGMDQDDLFLCLERHATSKIKTEAELAGIRSLGFRGEAIPSIASVAKLRITSRTRQVELGAQIDVRFGKVIKMHEMGAAPGTTIEVRDLFGNVPARRKFLKTVRTELAHIEEVIKNYSLAYHSVGFSYSVNGREQFNLPPVKNPEDRIRKVISPRQQLPLLAVSHAAAEQPDQTSAIRVHGFIVSPEFTTGAGSRLRIFINGRAVKDRTANHAVFEGMQGFLQKGGRPGGVLFIDLPGEEVDVNVHPTKQEIRFATPAAIHDQLVAIVKEALTSYQQKLQHDVFGSQNADEIRPSNTSAIKKPFDAPVDTTEDKDTALPQAPFTPLPEFQVEEPRLPFPIGTRKKAGTQNGKAFQSRQKPDVAKSFVSGKKTVFEEHSVTAPASERLAQVSGKDLPVADISAFTSAPDDCRQQQDDIRCIGQLFGSYILCSVKDNFIVIDQHAAQERLVYEKLKKQYRSGRVASQMLLTPYIMDFSATEISVIEKYADEIVRLGIILEEFGGDSYAIKAVPAIMARFKPVEIVSGVIQMFIENEQPGSKSEPLRMENVLSTIACKAAIKAGQSLLPQEMENLVDDMRKAHIFSHCPHGRPVFKTFSRDEVKRWFLRT